MRRPAAILPLLFLAGCGIQPSEAVEVGMPPVISAEPTLKTVYLLREGKLTPRTVSTSSGMLEDVMDALLAAGKPPPSGMTSALTGFTHSRTTLTAYNPGNRNDPEVPRGLRAHVVIRGDRELERAGMAQITCTAMLDKDIWGVEITQMSAKMSRPRGEHVCSEFRDLAERGTGLPP